MNDENNRQDEHLGDLCKDWFTDYVLNDLAGADPDYVRDVLLSIGCDEQYWDELGLSALIIE